MFFTKYLRYKSHSVDIQANVISNIITFFPVWKPIADLNFYKSLSKLFCEAVYSWNIIFLERKKKKDKNSKSKSKVERMTKINP